MLAKFKEGLTPYLVGSAIIHLVLLVSIQTKIVSMVKISPQLRLMMELERIIAEPEELEDRVIIDPKPVHKKKEELQKVQPKKMEKTKVAPRLDPKILELFPFPFYLDSLTRKIASHWEIVSWAGAKLERKATVRFKIDSSGQIQDVKLKDSSGDRDFDFACSRAVSLSDPLPPLPVDYENDVLAIVFDFELSY